MPSAEVTCLDKVHCVLNSISILSLMMCRNFSRYIESPFWNYHGDEKLGGLLFATLEKLVATFVVVLSNEFWRNMVASLRSGFSESKARELMLLLALYTHRHTHKRDRERGERERDRYIERVSFQSRTKSAPTIWYTQHWGGLVASETLWPFALFRKLSGWLPPQHMPWFSFFVIQNFLFDLDSIAISTQWTLLIPQCYLFLKYSFRLG